MFKFLGEILVSIADVLAKQISSKIREYGNYLIKGDGEADDEKETPYEEVKTEKAAESGFAGLEKKQEEQQQLRDIEAREAAMLLKERQYQEQLIKIKQAELDARQADLDAKERLLADAQKNKQKTPSKTPVQTEIQS